MSTETIITKREPNGRFTADTLTLDEKGAVLSHSPVVVEPGRFTAPNTFEQADLSKYPDEAQVFAAEWWTKERLDLWKEQFPYKAPPPIPTDQDILNEALIAKGSVVRALGLVMFAEINKLRVKGGDAPYTLAQFRAALVAQMR